MLEDTFHKQTSNCDLVDFPVKILLLAKTGSGFVGHNNVSYVDRYSTERESN